MAIYIIYLCYICDVYVCRCENVHMCIYTYVCIYMKKNVCTYVYRFHVYVYKYIIFIDKYPIQFFDHCWFSAPLQQAQNIFKAFSLVNKQTNEKIQYYQVPERRVQSCAAQSRWVERPRHRPACHQLLAEFSKVDQVDRCGQGGFGEEGKRSFLLFMCFWGQNCTSNPDDPTTHLKHTLNTRT